MKNTVHGQMVKVLDVSPVKNAGWLRYEVRFAKAHALLTFGGIAS